MVFLFCPPLVADCRLEDEGPGEEAPRETGKARRGSGQSSQGLAEESAEPHQGPQRIPKPHRIRVSGY